MDLKRRIGQLFLLGFQGDTVIPNHPIWRDIEEFNLGGVVLFDRLLAKGHDTNNIISVDQLRSLTGSLQSITDTPLFICVDQEGGLVCRLNEKRGFPSTIAARKLGQTDNTQFTVAQARITAELLSSLGINFNFAPVVDVNIYAENPVIGKLDRSFSSDPEKVIRHARAWVAAHGQNNILSCLKHFPGHGSSCHDSHLGFVDITDTWQKCELEPFNQLIEEGFSDAIMTGHLYHRNMDSDCPATLSSSVITGLLREKLHFDGLVISDDLQMRSITDHYGLVEASCMALAAGCDMIIIGNNLDFDENILPKLIHGVIQAIDQKQLTHKRIDQAYHHVQLAKRKLSPGFKK